MVEDSQVKQAKQNKIGGMSEEVFKNVQLVVREAARRGNPFAESIVQAWGSKPLDMKWKIFSRAYSGMFQLMVMVEMTVNSERTPEQVESAIKETLKNG